MILCVLIIWKWFLCSYTLFKAKLPCGVFPRSSFFLVNFAMATEMTMTMTTRPKRPKTALRNTVMDIFGASGPIVGSISALPFLVIPSVTRGTWVVFGENFGPGINVVVLCSKERGATSNPRGVGILLLICIVVSHLTSAMSSVVKVRSVVSCVLL